MLTPVVLGLLPAAAAEKTDPTLGLRWGMNTGAIDPLTEAGAKPDFAMIWVGPWTDGDWSRLDRDLAELKAKGVTPIIQWYYWGDDISPTCVENGCWSSLHGHSKNKTHWFQMVHTLAAHLETGMAGSEAIVIVETEFNKGGITSSDYAPVFDGYMREHMQILHGVPGVKTIAGFGTWGSYYWDRFPQTVGEADYVAMQALRSSVRNSLDTYLGTVDFLLSRADVLNEKFPGKPVFITDMGFSSYPEPEYAGHQNATLAQFFARLSEFQARGVSGFMYRSLFDTNMDPNNYHGAAESWWGLRHTDGTPKPAYQTWLDGVGATPPPPPPGIAVPAAMEAENMQASVGATKWFRDASGSYAWNLWSNGYVREWVNATDAGTYEVTVRARGTVAAEGWPQMVVSLGAFPVASFNVGANEWADYKFRVDLEKHRSTELRVSFTNDYRTSTEDRNLVVDRVDVALVALANPPPVAAFSWTADGLHATLDASASSDANGDALTYAWNLGDGSTATGRAVAHTYATSGDYVVTLAVSDGKGSDTVKRMVTVNRAPGADFHLTQEDALVKVNASPAADPDGDALTYAWDFGDGHVAEGLTAEHAFTERGTYVVTLVVSDGRASATASKEVSVVGNVAPAAEFTAAVSDLAVRVDASASSDADGDALTYAWDMGDGTERTGVTASHTYARGGTYTLTLTVSDGRVASVATADIKVNAPPSAAFTWSAQELTTSFDATTSKDPEGGALTYAWKYGDGATGTGATPVHRYTAPGKYAVTLTVSDGEASHSATREITIQPPAFQAKFHDMGGHEWWIQTRVDASHPVASVQARVNGGSWHTLTLRDWGAWAASFHAPKGSVLEFRATSAWGHEALSGTYRWPDATPYTPSPEVTFSNVKGHKWWVQTSTKSDLPVVEVKVQINGGTWWTLRDEGWGWGRGLSVPDGAKLQFRATTSDGTRTFSDFYLWPDATPLMNAKFHDVKGHNWWVQVKVDAPRELAGVDARVDGGSWKTLTLRDWGAWAASFHVPSGSNVEFRARAVDGSLALSGKHVWP